MAPPADPSIVVIAVIIVMLAGMTTTGGVQDAITGWCLTGARRIVEAVTNTVGLMKALHLWIMLIAAAFVALAFSVVAQNPVRTLAPTALLSSAVYAVDVAAARAGYGTWDQPRRRPWSPVPSACSTPDG